VVEPLDDDAYDASRNFLFLAHMKRLGIKVSARRTQGEPSGCTGRKLAAQEYIRDPEA